MMAAEKNQTHGSARVFDPAQREELPRYIRDRDSGMAMGWFYALSVFLSRVAALTLFEIRIFNAKRVPRSGAVILAGNHQSLLDPWLLGLSQLRRACYLARDSLFSVPVLGFLLRQYDSVPVARESTSARHSLEICVKVLEKKRALILFPEGTRSQDGKLQPLKRGISLIAKMSDALVVPVLVRGAYDLWPRTQKLPCVGQVSLYFGNGFRLDRSQSADTFVARLEASYRELAFEVGAHAMLPEVSRAEGGAVVALPSMKNGEPPGLPEAVGSRA